MKREIIAELAKTSRAGQQDCHANVPAISALHETFRSTSKDGCV